MPNTEIGTAMPLRKSPKFQPIKLDCSYLLKKEKGKKRKKEGVGGGAGKRTSDDEEFVQLHSP